MALSLRQNEQQLKLHDRILSIPSVAMQKYNKDTVTQIIFTLNGLESLRKKYRNVRGLPPFLHHTMKGRPTNVTKLILSDENLCCWTEDYNFIIIPNKCTNYESILENPLAIKDSEHGG